MGDERRRRVLSLTGVLPLGAYVLFHLVETGAAGGGRRAFADRLTGDEGGVIALVLETVLVLVPLAVHAILGLWFVARGQSSDPAGYGSPALRAWQRGTGVLLVAFLLFHLGDTWLAKLGGMDGSALYDHLRSTAGRPLYLVVYVVGITCLAFHLALGLGAFAVTWGIARTDGARRAARGLGALLAAAVWLVSLNTLSHFAVGQPLLGRSAESLPEGAR